LTGKLPFGGGSKDKENKPATPKASSASAGGGLGGALGGLTSRLPFGGKKDDKPAPPRSPGATGSAPPPGNRFGGGASSGPAAGSSSGAAGSSGRPMFGGAGAQSAAKPAAKAEGNVLTRFLPFLGGGAKAEKKPARPRESRAPKVETQGLTLDNKLDILGVVLVLGSLALFFSTLSSTKGALTDAVNKMLGEAFGWGATAIPVAMMAVGLWLIARHFGDQAPTVGTERVIGIVMLFVGALFFLMYFETFNYVGDRAINSLADLNLQLEVSWRVMRAGGGAIGAQLYYFMVANFSEFGAFFIMIAWIIIGVMLTLSLSAAEVAMIVIGSVRNFQDAQKQRSARRAIQQAEAAARKAAALPAQSAPAIGISGPEAPALPGGAMAALPPGLVAALPAPPEAAKAEPVINIGGRQQQAVPLTPAPASGPALRAPIPPPPGKPAEPAPGSALGRVRGMVPSFGGKKADDSAAPAESKPAESGGVLPRFGFGKQPPAAPTAAAAPEASPPAASATPAVPMATPAMASAAPVVGSPAPSMPNISFGGKSASTPPGRPVTPASNGAEAKSADDGPPARLGDVIRGTVPTPAAASAAPTPAASGDGPRSPMGRPLGGPTSPASAPGSPRPGAPAPGTPPAARPFGAPASNKPLEPASTLSKPAVAGTPALRDDLDAGELETDLDPAAMKPATPKGDTPVSSAPASRFAPRTFEKPAASGQPPATSSQPATGSERSLLGSKPADAASKPADTVEKPAASLWKAGGADKGPTETPIPKEPPKPPASSFGAPTTPPVAPSGFALGGASASVRPAQPTAPAPTPAPTASAPAPVPAAPPPAPTAPAAAASDGSPSRGIGPMNPRAGRRKDWKLPETARLLQPGSEHEFDREELLKRARLIENTLESFGAPGKVIEVNTGPVITQYGVEPDYLTGRGGKKNRVKVSAIAQLDKDIQLALGARSIRIEAPVPGKGYVGIEVPNEQAALVSLRDVMEADEFKKVKSPLAIALGQAVDGTPVAADLSSMPHLLIAGTTGSGKSVMVNAIICSILSRNAPDAVKFIMVDPKRVELTGYNGIPHLVAPVVVELERIVGVLKWVTREMDERYKKFSMAGARNIDDFNKHLQEGQERMPYMVVIIDELADLMMLAPDDTERVITRIAALARATGIHLVIATQRPSVDVVTGLIKANFPSRIAFAVASGTDSRVILDQPGAEKLLGRGDMLYLSGDTPAPARMQGVFVADAEIRNLCNFWKQQMTDEDYQARPISQLVLDNTVVEDAHSVTRSEKHEAQQQAFWDRDTESRVSTGLGDDGPESNMGSGAEDEMYEQAVETVRRLNKASVSLLQRRLRIGYTRAARLIDAMEEQGIVGPALEGSSKPRDVLSKP
jgi:DNA segregation ATPase FtsK/SpoIIIE-like protein